MIHLAVKQPTHKFLDLGPFTYPAGMLYLQKYDMVNNIHMFCLLKSVIHG